MVLKWPTTRWRRISEKIYNRGEIWKNNFFTNYLLPCCTYIDYHENCLLHFVSQKCTIIRKSQFVSRVCLHIPQKLVCRWDHLNYIFASYQISLNIQVANFPRQLYFSKYSSNCSKALTRAQHTHTIRYPRTNEIARGILPLNWADLGHSIFSVK